jgi:hypothetical protein
MRRNQVGNTEKKERTTISDTGDTHQRRHDRADLPFVDPKMRADWALEPTSGQDPLAFCGRDEVDLAFIALRPAGKDEI